jgi:nicotinate-nucleotide pyrophosphorylase (carboxylating)
VPSPEAEITGVMGALREAVARALAEDLGEGGDLTSRACVPEGVSGEAVLVARRGGVIAGLDAVAETFRQVDARGAPDVDARTSVRSRVRARARDGEAVEAGSVVAEVVGPLRGLLTAERTALNLVGHLSGVATTTRRYVDAVAGTGCVVRDTRKTTPGLRLLEKAAVVAGGGTNHRVGLHDALLVKDNHIVAAGGVAKATRAALAAATGRPVQIEVTSLEEAVSAVEAGARDLLIDNLDPEGVRAIVAAVGERARLEASGGVSEESVRAYARTGVHSVAVGRLTHSAPWLDIAMDVRGGRG